MPIFVAHTSKIDVLERRFVADAALLREIILGVFYLLSIRDDDDVAGCKVVVVPGCPRIPVWN